MAEVMAEHLTSQGRDFRTLTPPTLERWHTEWGFDDAEWAEAMEQAVLARTLWDGEPPEHEAVAALTRIAEAGHEVLILADPLERLHRPAVWRWLTAHVLNRVPVAGFLAAPLTPLVDVDVAVVRSVADFEVLDDEGEAVPLWISKPWNEDRAGLRACSWAEVVEVVEALTHDLVGSGEGVSCRACGERFSGEEIAARLLRVCSAIPKV